MIFSDIRVKKRCVMRILSESQAKSNPANIATGFHVNFAKQNSINKENYNGRTRRVQTRSKLHLTKEKKNCNCSTTYYLFPVQQKKSCLLVVHEVSYFRKRQLLTFWR